MHVEECQVSSRWGSCKQQSRGVLFVYMLLGCQHAVFFFLSRSICYLHTVCVGCTLLAGVAAWFIHIHILGVAVGAVLCHLCACVRTCWSVLGLDHWMAMLQAARQLVLVALAGPAGKE
jgi:hypothetical protein